MWAVAVAARVTSEASEVMAGAEEARVVGLGERSIGLEAAWVVRDTIVVSHHCIRKSQRDTHTWECHCLTS